MTFTKESIMHKPEELITTNVVQLLNSVSGLNEFYWNPVSGSLTDVRFVTIDEWLREFDLFEKLRQISFFRGFKLTKAFQTWKRVVKRAAFLTASQTIIENSCILGTNARMRDCFLQVIYTFILIFVLSPASVYYKI